MARMRTIKSLEELSTLVADQYAQGVELFVRTSTGPANDRKMGCSTNHASGQREAGMSVTTLVPHPDVFGVGDAKVVAQQVGSWDYVAPVTYILTGEVIGKGSDGEAVVDPATWAPVARIDTDAIKAQRAAMCDHPASRVQGGYCYDCRRQIA